MIRRKSVILSASEGSRNGFTLMELMVYMAILGIIVIVAGRAFSDSTKFRVRTQNILKATQEAENVATLFKSDVIQMGAKSSLEVKGTGGDDQFIEAEKAAKVHWADDDASSYNLTPGAEGGADALEFKRFRYDGQGKFVSVEQVRWFVENEILKRSCKTIDGTADDDVCPSGEPTVVEIASDVKEFQVWPATPGMMAGDDDDNQKFPPCAGGNCGEEFRMVPRSGDENFMGLKVTLDQSAHKMVTLSGFSSNYLMNEDKVDEAGVLVNQVFATGNADYGNSWKSACTAENFNLEAETEYEISFEVSDGGDADKMRMFVPGRDHMAVGFRYAKDGSKPGEIDDFLFYPPADMKGYGARKMRFSVPKTIEGVCLAFTFASYSPVAANGQVVISDLTLKKLDTSNYQFSEKNFSKENKERVKAFRMKLRIARAGETGDVDIVVPTPSNGVAD